jgi:hypothetical protein
VPARAFYGRNVAYASTCAPWACELLGSADVRQDELVIRLRPRGCPQVDLAAAKPRNQDRGVRFPAPPGKEFPCRAGQGRKRVQQDDQHLLYARRKLARRASEGQDGQDGQEGQERTTSER